jgi:hypothetical protein
MSPLPTATPKPNLPLSPPGTDNRDSVGLAPVPTPTPQPSLITSPQPTPPPTPTSVIIKNLAPSIALVPVGKVDQHDGRFRIEFSCRDSGDSNPTIASATLNGLSVTDGQIVELKLEDAGKQKVKRKKGMLTIEAQSFLPKVTCEDTSGNQGTATATLAFALQKEDDDDKGGHDD